MLWRVGKTAAALSQVAALRDFVQAQTLWIP